MPTTLTASLNRNFISFLFFAAISPCFSQPFQRTFGGTGSDVATCVKSTLDGNYIIGGITSSFPVGNDNACLLKIDSAGNLLWSRSYGGQYNDRAYYVSTCSDGGYILTGYTTFSTNGFMDLLLIRTDSNGTLQWSRAVGGSNEDYGWYVTETDDGGFLATGSTKSFNGGIYDGYIVKTDAAGTLEWTKAFGGTNTDQFYGMSKTTDGGYIITGSTISNSFGSSDIWLVKINSGGDTLWTRQYGKATEDAGNTVIQTADGGYIITGDVHINLQAVKHNSCLLKTDSLGNLQWVKTYGSSAGTEYGWDVKETGNGYLLLGSTGYYGSGSGDVMVVKTDTSGNMQWAKAYGTSGFDDFWYSRQTPDQGAVMVGSTTGGNDILVVRTDSLGNSSCNTVSIIPDVLVPTLQERRGTNIISGGVASNANAVASTCSFAVTDPCTTVPVPEETDPLELSVFPNPFSDRANIAVPGGILANARLRLHTIFGQEVLTVTSRNSTGFILYRGDIEAGIYLYKIESPDGVIGSGKIVIQ